MTDKIRQAAKDAAKLVEDSARFSESLRCPSVSHIADIIERAMWKLVEQPEASSSVRLDGETHCVDAQPVESHHVPTLTFGAGEFSCAVCGLGMEKPCEHWKPTSASEEELVKCITGYLASGGLFNPEMAIHDRVRDLLIDCRHALEIRAERVKEAVEAEREACAKIADEDFTLDEHTPCDEGHREFYKKYGTAEVCEAIRARGSSNALKEYVAERVKEAERQGGWVEHQKWCQYCCGNGDSKPKCSDGWALYAEAKR